MDKEKGPIKIGSPWYDTRDADEIIISKDEKRSEELFDTFFTDLSGSDRIKSVVDNVKDTDGTEIESFLDSIESIDSEDLKEFEELATGILGNYYDEKNRAKTKQEKDTDMQESLEIMKRIQHYRSERDISDRIHIDVKEVDFGTPENERDFARLISQIHFKTYGTVVADNYMDELMANRGPKPTDTEDQNQNQGRTVQMDDSVFSDIDESELNKKDGTEDKVAVGFDDSLFSEIDDSELTLKDGVGDDAESEGTNNDHYGDIGDLFGDDSNQGDGSGGIDDGIIDDLWDDLSNDGTINESQEEIKRPFEIEDLEIIEKEPESQFNDEYDFEDEDSRVYSIEDIKKERKVSEDTIVE